MHQIDLASEDEVSEAVGIRLIGELPGYETGLVLRRGGNGYLRSRLKSFCQMAVNRPILVLTDLDTAPCPAELHEKWFGRTQRPSSLLLRIAVREVESWLLADHVAILELMGRAAAGQLPDDPDNIVDPKALLLNLAKRAPRDVRLDLCAASGMIVRQGLGYNARLCEFVRSSWDPQRASSASHSLHRCRGRLRELASGAIRTK